MKHLLIILLAVSCNTPVTWTNKYNNLLTPDRLGVGVSNGIMNAHGISNKFMPNQELPMEMDMRGDVYSTSLWLEWDFPQWRDTGTYDKYLRERVIYLTQKLEEKELEDLW